MAMKRSRNTEATMAILPTEIILHEIFTRLPVESLLRFKCVSTSYNALISSPEFIDLHLDQSLSSDSNRLLILLTKNCKHLYLLDVDSPDPASTVVNIPLPYALDKLADKDVLVLSSFNGLLCVGLQPNRFSNECNEILLINPCTRVYRSIPRANCTPKERLCLRQSFGLGFDDINNDYKVVRVTVNCGKIDPRQRCPRNNLNREVAVYSLKENTWTLVEDVNFTSDYWYPGQNGVVLKNHLLHWVFLCKESGRYLIWCFDVRSNEWTTEVPLLPNNEVNYVSEINLGVLDGCLCLSERRISCEVVWMMKEYGVKESWVKLFDISAATPRGSERFLVPFGFRKESKHEVLIHDRDSDQEDKLFWCDTRQDSSNCRTEEIKGVSDFDKAFYFKGSLVAIPDGHRIEESTNQQV